MARVTQRFVSALLARSALRISHLIPEHTPRTGRQNSSFGASSDPNRNPAPAPCGAGDQWRGRHERLADLHTRCRPDA